MGLGEIRHFSRSIFYTVYVLDMFLNVFVLLQKNVVSVLAIKNPFRLYNNRWRSKLTVASQAGGLSCVCTLTELIFGILCLFHKLTVEYTIQTCFHPPVPTPPLHLHPSSASVLQAGAGPGAAAAGRSSHQCLL